MNSIIQDIFIDTIFSEKELFLLSSKLKTINLSKGDFLLKAGEEISNIYYVHSGCLRCYCIDKSGKEHILQFAIQGWWISDYIALFGGKKNAVSFIECLQDATLYKISKTDFDKICIDIPKIALFHIQKLESAFAHFQNRILKNLTLSAKERYTHFVQTYPDIESNVKNYHIASFLGITTESLSRIRKEISTV